MGNLEKLWFISCDAPTVMQCIFLKPSCLTPLSVSVVCKQRPINICFVSTPSAFTFSLECQWANPWKGSLMLRGATQCDTTSTEGRRSRRSHASFWGLIKNDDDYNSNDEKVSPELTCANVVVRAIAQPEIAFALRRQRLTGAAKMHLGLIFKLLSLLLYSF